MTEKIPRIINYVWVGGKPKPPLVLKCLASWAKQCPDYRIVEWNESNFPIDSFPLAKSALTRGNYALASDVIRNYALVKNGGFYLDTDMELIKPLDSLLTYDAALCYESDHWLNSAFLAGIPNHPIYRVALARLQAVDKIGFNTNALTVHAFSAIMRLRYGVKPDGKDIVVDNIRLLPQEYFYPLDYMTGELNTTLNTIGIHNYLGSWHNARQKNGYTFARTFRRRVTKNFFGLFEKSVADHYYHVLKKELEPLITGEKHGKRK